MKKTYYLILIVASIVVSATGFYLGFTEVDSTLAKLVELGIGTFSFIMGVALTESLNQIETK